MKFIRFGDLKAFRQKRYKKCPDVEEYPHAPPRAKGFFAFPYGFVDMGYVTAMAHPACNPNSPYSYLRYKSGRKLTMADQLKEGVCLKDAELLRQLGLPTNQPILHEDRPSWVCVMKNAADPPRLTGDGRLNQEFEYLLDVKGERVKANGYYGFFDREWRLDDFTGDNFAVCALSDIDERATIDLGITKRDEWWRTTPVRKPYSHDELLQMVLDYLGEKGIGVERLFAWPAYKEDEDVWLTVFKKPHIFSYTGCLWHHLRKFVPSGSVLASYGLTWVYTTVRDFGRALRHLFPSRFCKLRTLQAKADRCGGPYCGSDSVDVNEMFEVFFDAEDIKKIT